MRRKSVGGAGSVGSVGGVGSVAGNPKRYKVVLKIGFGIRSWILCNTLSSNLLQLGYKKHNRDLQKIEEALHYNASTGL